MTSSSHYFGPAWFLFATLVHGVAGCSPGSTPTTAPPPSSMPAAARGSALPQRIVTIAPNAAETIAALGEGARLVGVSTFCVYPPELTRLPKVGGLWNPDLETILRLRPDLVVIRGQSVELEGLCRRHGIRLFVDPTESFEDIFTATSQLGEVLGKQKEAEALNADIRRRIEAIGSLVADRPRPRVLFIPGSATSSLSHVTTTTGGGTFLDVLITLAGGRNVFGHYEISYPDVSLEDVLAAKPEVIIEALPDKTLSDALRREAVSRWRRVGPIPAAQDNRVHVLTQDHILIPSPRVADSVREIAKLLHPEVDFD